MNKLEYKNITNKCTLKKLKVLKTVTQEKTEQKLYNELEYFLKYNLKSFTWGCSSSYYWNIELIQKAFEFNFSNKIIIDYDISKLKSNVASNSCDGINIYFNNDNLQCTNLYLYEKIVNSDLFKYYEYIMYSIIEGICYHTAVYLNNCEDINCSLDDDESNEDYIFINNDFISDVFNSKIEYIIE